MLASNGITEFAWAYSTFIKIFVKTNNVVVESLRLQKVLQEKYTCK